MENVNGFNCEWCIQPPKDEDEIMKFKGFIPPPSSVFRTNEHTFEGNNILATDTDLQELLCPSKFKKLGSDAKKRNIKGNNLVRSKMQCSMCFKHRDIYTFLALEKNQKKSLLDHFKVF